MVEHEHEVVVASDLLVGVVDVLVLSTANGRHGGARQCHGFAGAVGSRALHTAV